MRWTLLLGLWQVKHCLSQREGDKITFHCDVDRQNANAAWSREKREWCCEELGVACEEDFHCSIALRNYERAWSLAKKKFCCKKEGIACKGLEDEVFFSTKAPQVDPGNLLAQAPVADWPEAEGEGKIAEAPDEELFMPCDDMTRRGLFVAAVRPEEGSACWQICKEDHLRMRVAPWLSGFLFLIVLGYAFWKARCAKDDGDFDRWANGIILGHQLWQAVAWSLLLFWLMLTGPELFIFDSNRPATCFKAYLAWMFSLPQLPDPSTWPWWLSVWLWWLEDYKSCIFSFFVAVFRWQVQYAVGRCKRGPFPPEDYSLHRPLRPKYELSDEETLEASREVSSLRAVMNTGSFFATWFAADCLCQGRSFITLACALGMMATARKSASLHVNRYDMGNSRPGRLQCPWGSDTVTLVRLSDDPGLGLPCNELVAKCSIKAAAESGVILYTTTAVVVAGHAANWAELVLPFVAASYALHAVSLGVGICFEIASAELSRTATHKGVQGVGAASVQAPAHENCPKCSNRYMSDSKCCRRCGTKRATQEQVSQDGKYCASLIQFQDYSARQVLKKWRLKTMGTVFRISEVLAVAVGLSLWCLGGQLLTGFMVGVLLATTWELLHPAKLEDLKGYARNSISFRLWNVAERVFECLLWPIYGSFAPLHLADPTRDHNEEEAGLDSLMLPAWCGLRTLFIVILWTWTILNSQNFPKFPAFWSLENLVDPRQYQLLIAWCWVIAGACAAMAFPAVSVRVHRRREKWAVADWKRFVRNEEDPWRTVQDVITMPAMWNLRNYDSEAGEEHLHTLEQQLDLEDDVLAVVQDFWSGGGWETDTLLPHQVRKQQKVSHHISQHVSNILQEKHVTAPCTVTLIWGVGGAPHKSNLDLIAEVNGKPLSHKHRQVGKCKLDFDANAALPVKEHPAENITFNQTGIFEIHVDNSENRDNSDVPFKVLVRKAGRDVEEYEGVWPRQRMPGQLINVCSIAVEDEDLKK